MIVDHVAEIFFGQFFVFQLLSVACFERLTIHVELVRIESDIDTTCAVAATRRRLTHLTSADRLEVVDTIGGQQRRLADAHVLLGQDGVERGRGIAVHVRMHPGFTQLELKRTKKNEFDDFLVRDQATYLLRCLDAEYG